MTTRSCVRTASSSACSTAASAARCSRSAAKCCSAADLDSASGLRSRPLTGGAVAEVNRYRDDPVEAPCQADDDGMPIWGRAPVGALGSIGGSVVCGREYEDHQAWPPPAWHGKGGWCRRRKSSAPVRRWRSTLVYWAAITDTTAQLTRATELPREVGARRPALSSERVQEYWACRGCGSVARRPPHAPDVQHPHLARCPVANGWRVDRWASDLLRCRMEVSKGIFTQTYRCWECRKSCSEKALDDLLSLRPGTPVELRRFHRVRCSARGGKSNRAGRSEVMRVREVSGQTIMFAEDARD